MLKIRRRRLPSWEQLRYLRKFYSAKEILASKLSLFFILAAALALGANLYFNNLEKMPAPGGQIIEAAVGAPTYVNPLFSQTNDADQDLVNLIFSGLLKIDESGRLAPDLAASYAIDEKGLVYTFTLRSGAKWHDGEAVTADDVVFTAQSIKEQNFKSPLNPVLRNVEVKKIDDLSLSFTLPEPLSPFLAVFTFGILPEHLWRDIDPAHAILADLNLRPIGSGPYRFASLLKDKKGNIREYRLERFNDYYQSGPFIGKISLKFFDNYEDAASALASGNADSFGFLPRGEENFKKSGYQKIYNFDLPQYTAVFFNQGSSSALADKNVRAALALATSREQIIKAAFSADSAQPAYSPIPPGFVGYDSEQNKPLFDPAAAAAILDAAGWARSEEGGAGQDSNLGLTPEEKPKYARKKKVRRDNKEAEETLTVTLTAAQRPETVKAAEALKALWENIGVKVELKIVDLATIQKDVIKPRAFEALLFGQILGRDPDPYPFWHSSQANDPGLNLPRWANRTADKLLEEARQTPNPDVRQKNYLEFQKLLNEDMPAIFLYRLNYVYILPDNIKGNGTQIIHKPSDRFANINKWFIKTKRRLKFN